MLNRLLGSFFLALSFSIAGWAGPNDTSESCAVSVAAKATSIRWTGAALLSPEIRIPVAPGNRPNPSSQSAEPREFVPMRVRPGRMILVR